MSSLSHVLNNTDNNVLGHSHFAKIKWGIPKIVFPIMLGICTAFLFYQTWLVQHSCSPIIGAHLLGSIQQAKAGNVTERELIEE